MKDRQPPGFSSADNGALHVVLAPGPRLTAETSKHVHVTYVCVSNIVDKMRPENSAVT